VAFSRSRSFLPAHIVGKGLSLNLDQHTGVRPLPDRSTWRYSRPTRCNVTLNGEIEMRGLADVRSDQDLLWAS